MNATLAQVLALHLDPEQGSPWWLARQDALGFDLRARLRDIDDLPLLGPFDLGVFHAQPLEAFIPRSVRARSRLLYAETGGTTGSPVPTAYTPREFHAAFIQPLLDRIDRRLFAAGGNWLWLGPSGPHVIGQAARRIALLTTRRDAFCIDFDPRWFRKLAPGSLGRTRYLEHVLEQACALLAVQDVRYLFATPVVLRELLPRLTPARRSAVRFVYLGGMPVEPEVMGEIVTALPQASFLAGYGNTLFGVCHEAAAGRDYARTVTYHCDTARLHLRLVAPDAAAAGHLDRGVAAGQRGQIMMHRLDASLFLPCVLERDHAIHLAGEASSGAQHFADPRPPAGSGPIIDKGIY